MGAFPGLVPLLAKGRSWEHVCVRRGSEICIEGFPRSANTYAVAAFRLANPGCGHIARHSHLAGQVIRAVGWGIPTLVLVREPEDAALSMKIREPSLGLGMLVRSYCRFYRSLMPLRGRFCVGRFDEVTSDYGAVVGRVNGMFGTDFGLPDGSEEGRERLLRRWKGCLGSIRRGWGCPGKERGSGSRGQARRGGR